MALGGNGDLFDIYTLFGIAWVMALFEGTVAYVMISASMKSMDPFTTWFLGRVKTIHGVDLTEPMPKSPSELVVDSDRVAVSAR